MPPTMKDRLQDILEAIIEIEDIVRGLSFDQFASDRRIRLLWERLLEIVCEASRATPDEIKQRRPDIDWRKMVDFGNLLRHAYHMTKAEIVWDVIQSHLPPLKAFVENLIRSPGR
ncbi:MAG TPA: HepT-like ribonuclease domain-containing protein [Bradyrhizobium sp.]|nr:HepT-like ribonuclease domain-containing protein [Bradyrhizobium sp.]